MEFDSAGDRFDMESFGKLQPILAVALILTLAVGCLERFSKILSSAYHARNILSFLKRKRADRVIAVKPRHSPSLVIHSMIGRRESNQSW